MKYLSILSVKLASLDIEENLDSFLEFGAWLVVVVNLSGSISS